MIHDPELVRKMHAAMVGVIFDEANDHIPKVDVQRVAIESALDVAVPIVRNNVIEEMIWVIAAKYGADGAPIGRLLRAQKGSEV